MATGLNIDTDFSNSILYYNNYHVDSSWYHEYLYIRAPAFYLYLNNYQGYGFGHAQYDYELSYWNGSSWAHIIPYTDMGGNAEKRSIRVNTTVPSAQYTYNSNHTMFRFHAYCQDRTYLTVKLYGIGGMVQSQKDKIRGKSPVYCSDSSPVHFSTSNLDSSIFSESFMSEVAENICINDIANSELKIQPPHSY